ncbi:restriction endonuclease subunit S [Curvibacter sp. HBC28]|uniref:Restriction endonuclease subunit S n=1 Tax=Curvibacter microcysteis TaxID=3026419 RepID=A0ABT5MFH6_9BURK|nr:restriction endonuclease subunit S [Curvibacter sp. HBC28]MDD0815317.1 restriction endonuclease subunit S [Curvibacter sp. HBC28]
MSVSQYADYEDSGFDWLGKVPAHWEVAPLKRYAAVQTGIAKGKDNEGKNTVAVPYLRVANVQDGHLVLHDMATIDVTADAMSRYRLRPGDVLMNEGGDADKLGRGCIWQGEIADCIHQNHVFAVRPQGVSSEWLNWVTSSAGAQFYFLTRSKQSTNLASISSTNIMELPLVVPPIDEQASITAFLDRETAKIDTLIAEQEKLLTLLAEKRQATISHAVTKGLNPDVSMKDSGVEWLGEVPEHWDVNRLKFIASVQTGIAKGKDTADKETIAIPYLRVANVQDGYLALDDVAIIEIEVEQLERYRLAPGDVLMNEGGDFDKLGRGAVWRGEIADCIHQNHVFAVRPHGVSSEWLNLITSSRYAQFYFMSRSKQSTNLASISSTNIMELPVVLPPQSEQRTILAFLKSEIGKLDSLTNRAKRAIGLFNERRSALISAAVTGKIDVRNI